MDTNKKVSRSASSLADLVARQLSVTPDDLNDMFNIGRASFCPMAGAVRKIRITAIKVEGTATANSLMPKVDWSYANVADFVAKRVLSAIFRQASWEKGRTSSKSMSNSTTSRSMHGSPRAFP